MRLHYADYWDIHRRRSTRLTERDYAADGMYFVTICTTGRECLMGEIVDGEMRLNEFGTIVHKCWHALPEHFPFVRIDAFAVMPNHVHGIVILNRACRGKATECRGAACCAPTPDKTYHGPFSHSLGAIVRSFKSATTKQVNIMRDSPGERFWQRNYHDRIIRDDELHRIREYIKANPARWNKP